MWNDMIEIVIKIPKETYVRTLEEVENEGVLKNIINNAIADGVLLPKGHGRLIDADALNFNADYNEPLISKLDFDNAPTIIGADEAESEEQSES